MTSGARRAQAARMGHQGRWRRSTGLLVAWNVGAVIVAALLWLPSCEGPLGAGDACGLAESLATAVFVVLGGVVWLVGNVILAIAWLVGQRDATTSTMTIAALLVTGLFTGALGLTRLTRAGEADSASADVLIAAIVAVIGGGLVLLALRQARVRRAR